MKLSSGILGVTVAAISLSSGLEGLRRFGRSLAGQQLAAAPSPVLTVLGASAVLVLGSWLCIALLRHRWARFMNPCVVWRSPPFGGPLPSQSCCLRRALSRT